MDYISKQIIKHKTATVVLFVVIAVICALLSRLVSVNYNMADYLPADSQSTVALSIMNDEFESSVPNAEVMIKNVSLTEALEYKNKLAAINGVDEILWLDDVVNIKEPIEIAEKDTVESYYKNGTAKFSLTISSSDAAGSISAIYDLIGEDNALAGNIVDLDAMRELSSSEAMSAMFILVPVIIVILLLTTSSWLEPLLFLATIGIAVLINIGTNIFLGEISFLTQSISPIMQMAVSLDYAIFLLHSFESMRKQTNDIPEAMRQAMKKSFSAIAASAATTFFGFIALTFMKFRIGSDLGINLVKGIVLSFLSVMIFLPSITLICYKLIDKTKHKKIFPDFKSVGNILVKVRIPSLIIVALLIVPSFMAQRNNEFFYGSGSINETGRSGKDKAIIASEFSETVAIVLLVPKGEPVKEALLCDELKQTERVTGVVSYATMVGVTIPVDYLDPAITKQFYSENYCRIIVYTDTEDEGAEAFATVESIQNMARKYYGSTIYSCGQSANLNDMKNVSTADSKVVNWIAIIAIALVLLVTFKSLTLPVLLVITIETAIWVNLSFPYFSGNPLCYIGYLVINTVQLGATVDYAILLTDNYMRKRLLMPKLNAIKAVLEENFISILISATILTSAGFCLAGISTNPIVAEMGVLLSRGTILSMSMVVFFLPTVLTGLDKITEKTTLNAKFFKEVKHE